MSLIKKLTARHVQDLLDHEYTYIDSQRVTTDDLAIPALRLEQLRMDLLLEEDLLTCERDRIERRKACCCL
jgi:hypothetical protein